MIELRMPGRQVRTSFAELTRCAHCGVLDAFTKPLVIVDRNKQDRVLLTVWLHEKTCQQQWTAPVPLQIQHSGQYRVPYRKYVPVQERRKGSFAWMRRPKVPRECAVYCYCCEAFELPDHKFNRLGYEPVEGWPNPRQGR